MQYAQEPKAQEYAQEHLRFLKENRPDVLAELRRSGDLNSYLSSVGSQAADRLRFLMSQYQHSPEVQKLPPLQRERALQSRHHEIEETIRDELLHQPRPE